MLRVLENKGHLTHVLEDGRYVYRPIVPRNRARRSALQNLLQTFFDGSTEKAVAALLPGIQEPAERGQSSSAFPASSPTPARRAADMNAFLAASLVKATLLLLATAFALRALARASAASRHLVAFLGLALALAVPVLGLVLPRWEIPLLSPAARPAARDARRASRATRRRRSPSRAFPGASAYRCLRWRSPLPRRAAGRPPRRPDLGFAQVAAFLWVLGGLVPLAALAVGFRRARTLIRNARPAGDPDLESLAAEASARLGLNRTVPVLLSPEALVPMTASFFRPVLVLPESARTWPRERLRVVLLHELAHVSRRDLGALLVAEVTTAAYWFHPLRSLVGPAPQAERRGGVGRSRARKRDAGIRLCLASRRHREGASELRKRCPFSRWRARRISKSACARFSTLSGAAGRPRDS